VKIKFILPALQEAKTPFWRPIKYSLFPPLGLATLAAFCSEEDEVSIVDEHIEELTYDDSPDLVCIQTYITNALHAYEIGDYYRQRGVYVAMGGLHATTLPVEAKAHADTVLLGIGETSFPLFLKELREGKPRQFYQTGTVCLDNLPLPRRDLLKRSHYLVPNSMVFSRGCPNQCSFCYVNSFFEKGKSFYTCKIDRILKELDTLPGKHLYFLDDNLFADKKLCKELFREMKSMNRVFQGAITVNSILEGDLIEEAYEAGFRSAFIGFESMNQENLMKARKHTNINQPYQTAVKRLDELGIMINGSFIFGMEEDNKDTFSKTVAWAIESGITTATFHILTPYPGTSLFRQMKEENRIQSFDWNAYDTRHLVFRHNRLTKEEMEYGYQTAYREFYRWNNIRKAAMNHEKVRMSLKHFTYAGAWKKFEPVWNFIVKQKLFPPARRILEKTLR